MREAACASCSTTNAQGGASREAEGGAASRGVAAPRPPRPPRAREAIGTWSTTTVTWYSISTNKRTVRYEKNNRCKIGK
eukprot:7387117-Prymnesium_polylepis.1